MSSRLSNTARSSVTLFWTLLPLLISFSQSPAQEKAAEKAHVAQTKRSLEFLVSDENGQPLKEAKLYANVAYLDESSKRKIVNSDLVTNAAGVAKLSLPPGTRSMRVWVSRLNYVSEFVSFGEGPEVEDKKIPTHFEFQLARGTKISGIVVDASGKPVPDVTVSVSVNVGEPDLSSGPQPIISINTEAVTDKAGKWSTNIAPAKRPGDDIKFSLKFTHPDYLSDSAWGELQNQQNLTTAMLRDGSAQIVLRQGVAVKGTVYNTAGDPITKGIIIWHDEPYYGSTVHEVEIGKSGTFETIPLPSGKHPITVVAPGFKPIRQIVDVSKSMDELTFTMKPGKTLTLKIVETSGKPVPKAHVGLRKWNGVESLYNWRHPNVLNSGIPTHADENGVYVWDWAPDDPVTYQIYGGSCAAKEVTLVATEKGHVIKLDRPLIASGKVTDAATGKPVTTFRVIPVIEFRPDFLSTSFDSLVIGKAGKYKITLNSGWYDRRHLIRIEADGYRSALSETSFGLGDGPVAQTFSLERASARKGLVIDRSGKPVSNATIRVGTPSIVPIVQNGESERQGMPDNTSGKGEFQIAATFEPTRIRAAHESGFVEIVRQPEEAIGTLTLQPWATISGRLFQAGKPVADALILFKTLHDRKLGEPRFQDSFYTQTDADGHFKFKQLPPIPGAVQAYLGPWEESPLTSSQSVSLDLQPGEHKTMELGNKGTTVTGTVVATGRGEATLNKNWSLNYLIRRDHGIPLPEDFPELSFDPAGPVQTSWVLDPNFYSWLRSRQHYFVKLSPEGQLQIGGVSPGDYDLVLRLYEQPAGCLVEAVGIRVIPVTVTTDDIKAGNKDLGSIEVACRVGPRVGESMYAYKFTDTTGVEHSIFDLKGRYVLMHVWASWCAPCLKSMPDIQATADQLSEKPLTFVGLNVDQYPEDAKRLVEKNKWNWAQNYLGVQSDMARQLAISSVPVYYLIGPDGKLNASASEWSQMKAALKETFKQD
ncbi:thioredoxin-like domain-containing protein [Gimesia algae]|uniref:Thiol-disulfide oxidoreductase ResA n=1 Tax=Gimesia algae TaxID=2527971 RepID=A0A517V616_9PLAN|nr:thioredoxin-like domain-containing protein [Gimesia algae]QDT88449.1 Thiol-disulfide oxidoreductase ResA [Gimesia algae]